MLGSFLMAFAFVLVFIALRGHIQAWVDRLPAASPRSPDTTNPSKEPQDV